MKDCIFCKIVEGKIPCYKVWEDENFLAFLDINPVGVGHTLVIPKKHFSWVWDLPAGRQETPNIGEYFEKVREVALLLKERLGARWVKMSVVGIEIPHAHVHLIPQEVREKVEAKDFSGVLRKLKS